MKDRRHPSRDYKRKKVESKGQKVQKMVELAESKTLRGGQGNRRCGSTDTNSRNLVHYNARKRVPETIQTCKLRHVRENTNPPTLLIHLPLSQSPEQPVLCLF